MIFLSGPMGSGKSTVARAVARRANLPCVDLDARIEAREGKRVRDIFAEGGEVSFRALEAEVLEELLSEQTDAVVALGGGTVTQPSLRSKLLRSGTLITLDASPAELAARIGTDSERPLLAGGPVPERLAGLMSERAAAYGECHGTLTTTGRTPEALADAVLEVVSRRPVVVPLGTRTYQAHVGRGGRQGLSNLVQAAVGSGRVLMVSDANVGPLWARGLKAHLESGGQAVTLVELDAGEQAKNLTSVQRLWDAALDAGLDRGSLVLGVGGGVVGDLSGFAAATILRGVAVGHVPTSLLAMVDSAVGGKTGFDTRHGKNLIGAFHQPSFVLCDVEVLSSLPVEERRSGLAEVVKSAWIDSEAAVAMLERDAAALIAGEVEATERAVRMAVQLKAGVVSRDEREAGRRAVLNLGHTLGHAIEASLDFVGMRHGEAVALGMVAAFRAAVHTGAAPAGALDRIVTLLSRLGLPVDVDPHLGQDVLAFIGADKKRIGDQVHLVVPGPPGSVSTVPTPIQDLARLFRQVGPGST